MRDFLKFLIIFLGGIWTVCIAFLSNAPWYFSILFGISAIVSYIIVSCVTVNVDWKFQWNRE